MFENVWGGHFMLNVAEINGAALILDMNHLHVSKGQIWKSLFIVEKMNLINSDKSSKFL